MSLDAIDEAESKLRELAALRQGIIDCPLTEWPALEAMDTFYAMLARNADMLLAYAGMGVDHVRGLR